MSNRARTVVGGVLLVFGVALLFAGAELIAALLHVNPGDSLGLIPYEPPALIIGSVLIVAGICFLASARGHRRSGPVS